MSKEYLLGIYAKWKSIVKMEGGKNPGKFNTWITDSEGNICYYSEEQGKWFKEHNSW